RPAENRGEQANKEQKAGTLIAFYEGTARPPGSISEQPCREEYGQDAVGQIDLPLTRPCLLGHLGSPAGAGEQCVSDHGLQIVERSCAQVGDLKGIAQEIVTVQLNQGVEIDKSQETRGAQNDQC